MEVETIIRILLPPTCREHVLGDLRESAAPRRPGMHDLMFTAPAVVWSQMRRSTPPMLLLAQGLAAYIAFAQFAFMPGGDRAALVTGLWPVLAALAVLVLIDTYRTAVECTWRRHIAMSAIAGACAGLAASVFMALPARMILLAATMAPIGIFTLRVALLTGERKPWTAFSGPLPVDEIRKRGRRFEDEVRNRTLAGYVVTTFVAAVFACYAVILSGVTLRIGACLTVGGAMFLFSQIWRKRLLRPQPQAGDPGYVRFFHDELIRQAEFHGGAWFWARVAALMPGPVIFILGMAQVRPEAASFSRLEIGVFLAVLGVSVPINLKMARRYRRQLDQLNTSIEE